MHQAWCSGGGATVQPAGHTRFPYQYTLGMPGAPKQVDPGFSFFEVIFSPTYANGDTVTDNYRISTLPVCKTLARDATFSFLLPSLRHLRTGYETKTSFNHLTVP